MKVIISNKELEEIVKEWALKKFNKESKIEIKNKKNGVEIEVELSDEVKTEGMLTGEACYKGEIVGLQSEEVVKIEDETVDPIDSASPSPVQSF